MAPPSTPDSRPPGAPNPARRGENLHRFLRPVTLDLDPNEALQLFKMCADYSDRMPDTLTGQICDRIRAKLEAAE